MKKLLTWIKAQLFSIMVIRKGLIKRELICCLDNVEHALECYATPAEKIKSLQSYILMHKVNLKWLVGTMDRSVLEDIYLRRSECRPAQPERILKILKFRR